jgi:hypothetical protein
VFASVEHRVSGLLLFAAIGATLPFVMVVAVAASPLGAIAGVGRRYLDSTPRELAAYAAGTVVAVGLWVAALFTGAATAPEWTVTAIVTAVLAAGAGLAVVLAAVKVVGAVGRAAGLDAQRTALARAGIAETLEYYAAAPDRRVDDLDDLVGSDVRALGRDGAMLVGATGRLVAVRDDAIVVRDGSGDHVVPRDRAGRGRRAHGYAAAVVIETTPRRRRRHTRTWHVDAASLTPTDDELRAAKPGPFSRRRDVAGTPRRAQA